jgi:5-methylcytosine-specific restriction endonuclease McrA
MIVPVKTDDARGFKITRVPIGFSNFELLKKQGLIGPKVKAKKKHKHKHKPNRRVLKRLPGCLMQIPVHQRLLYLQNRAKEIIEKVSFHRLATMRTSFDEMKERAYPFMYGLKCWACMTRSARLRHHIHQLQYGGTNKRNNIVPLCFQCHAKIHPHLDKSSSEGVASEYSVKL